MTENSIKIKNEYIHKIREILGKKDPFSTYWDDELNHNERRAVLLFAGIALEPNQRAQKQFINKPFGEHIARDKKRIKQATENMTGWAEIKAGLVNA